MKNILIKTCVIVLLAISTFKGYSQSAEVIEMMDYIILAEQAGLNVQTYLMELSDQLALVSASQYMDKEILEQGEAAARMYAHPLICLNYASCLMKRGKYGSALYFLAVAWHQDKQNYILATNIARCHYELGDNELADAFLERALKLNPDDGLALQLKATMLLAKGDYKSQQEAVGYVFKSALDVWNHISVKHFGSLAGTMERMYDIYRDSINRSNFNNIVKLATPVDDYINYFVLLQQVGQSVKPKVKLEKFVYPIPARSLEHDERYIISFFKFENSPSIIDAAIGNEFIQKALHTPIPTKQSDYPGEYSGMLGGNTFLPDSRAFNVTMVAYFYHQIKLLEAKHNMNVKQDYLLKPTEESVDKALEPIAEKMRKDRKLLNPYVLKGYGDRIYGYARQYISAAIRTRIECYDEYMQPAMENYQRDIKSGLYYIADLKAFKYLQTRYDYDVVKYYEQSELMYFGDLQNELNWGHYFTSEAEAMIRYQQNYLIETREERVRNWKINQDLKAAGMENVGKYPAPQLDAQIGGLKMQVSVDAVGRIMTRVETKDGVRQNIYNPTTGASSSTVLIPVKAEEIVGGFTNGKKPYYLPEGFTGKVDLPGGVEMKLGNFRKDGDLKRGMQIVKDARGNIIESSFVSQTTTSHEIEFEKPFPNLSNLKIPVSWKDFINAGATSIQRTTKTVRMGSSVISSSTKNSVSFNVGFGMAGIDLVSVGLGKSGSGK